MGGIEEVAKSSIKGICFAWQFHDRERPVTDFNAQFCIATICNPFPDRNRHVNPNVSYGTCYSDRRLGPILAPRPVLSRNPQVSLCTEDLDNSGGERCALHSHTCLGAALLFGLSFLIAISVFRIN